MRLTVLGTDTGVGKTLVATTLTAALTRAGHAARYWKPLSTGEDRDEHTASRAGLDVIPPAYAFLRPAAPHVAAADAGVELDAAHVRAALPSAEAAPTLVVEGVGGVLVPVDARGTPFADLVADWGLPAIVVARTALGTMNHTLLTLEALRLRGVRVLGVVLSGPPSDGLAELVTHVGRAPLLGWWPWIDGAADDHARAAALAPHADALAARLLEGASSSSSSPAWLDEDRAHVWRPYTAMKLAPAPLPVARTRGATLTLTDGRALLDATASWWTNAHGHAHPRLVRALAAQAATVGQVLYASFAHEPGARLAAELSRRAPGGPDALPRVFYSDDGSTAVEVAIKIAYQAFRNSGDHRRRRLVALDGAYHGDTFGAMSAGGDGVFHAAFKELLFEVEHVAVPGWPSSAPPLDAVLDAHGDEVFAVIVEPLLQGAAGMRTYAPEFLAHVRARTAALGVPLIADEVFTGFGRTGAMFACTRAGVVPDLLCLSKALTAGLLPMGATLASQALFDAFWSDDRRHTLFHGHSFTGNPLACAVALEGLAIFDDEDVLGHVARLEAAARPRLDALARHPRVAAARGLGAVWAVDLRTDGDGSYLDPIGQRVARRMLERGVFVRPMGPVVYLVASSAMSVADVARFFDALEVALDAG